MESWMRILPEGILSVGGTIVLAVCALGPQEPMRNFLRWLSLLFVSAAAFALMMTHGIANADADTWTITTAVTTSFSMVLLAMTGWVIAAGSAPVRGGGEWFALLQFVGVGALILTRASNLTAVFLGVEVLSIALYVLVAFHYEKKSALRAGALYLALAGFASAFLIFGAALVYAAYGTLKIIELRDALSASPVEAISPVALVGFALFLAGVGFKLAAVPFHMWAADVYEAAPSAISGGIAAISKGATIAAFIPFLFLVKSHFYAIAFMAAASMIIGNLLGLRETRVKRILAYSSVAHVGYILLGYLAARDTELGNGATRGVTPILFYVAVYGFSALGAFVSLAALRPDGNVNLNQLHGAARKHPVISACLLIFILSLAGLPLPATAGFWGKLYLFSAAFQAGYMKLAILGLIGSAIGLFYYLRIIVHLFMVAPEAGERITPEYSGLQTGILVATATAVVVFGILPDSLLRLLIVQ